MKYDYLIKDIPNINKYCLEYIFEDLKLKRKENTLWLEFGVASGRTINYFSKFTTEIVYGFDSFEGLPDKWRDGFERGSFSNYGKTPDVNYNVKLIKGLFEETLNPFLCSVKEKVSFLHIDSDLYSSAKYILNALTKTGRLEKNCIIVFDELVNFPNFDGDSSELRSLHEWTTENPNIKWEWIGMNGTVGMENPEYHNEQCCLRITDN
ncbi:MAG: hypothetical protein O3A15_00215 [Proteobacteria bacterium]|nr:hypothetical protein [Pseudomonadota bacterium]